MNEYFPNFKPFVQRALVWRTDLAATELIQEMLKTAMQDYLPNRVKPVAAPEDEIYDELPGTASDGVARINSKNL